MSLACLVCHAVDSPSRSFRSYSVSSSDEARCSTIINCLTKKTSLQEITNATFTSSKVTPDPIMANGQGLTVETPRLVRSCAVRRDLVRDWNFDEVVNEH